MKTYTVDELKTICEKHIKWLRNEKGGERANLQGADLQGADLQGADLQGADLRGADLRGAGLQRADLQGADLRGADLQGADLRGAGLQRADLRGANLRGADLRDADLQGADLQGADLRGAKNSALACAMTIVASEGDLIGWKKARAPNGGECIVKLAIPASAKRSNATGRKCRAEYAVVLAVEGAEYGKSSRNPSVEYRVGETVRPDSWDENRWEECSHGIHFFITREEAEAWEL